jgi:outer membrane protein assembly factor BamD (BamD/ComL family)
MVMLLMGRVSTNDGTALPNNVMIERICNANVRQQVYASSTGDFTMQLGSRTDTFVDASGDGTSRDSSSNRDSVMGIPRRDLWNCELRASASGFRSKGVQLDTGLTTSARTIDVGAIVVQRATKVEGMTLSATPYNAPKDAVKAYEKGSEAEKNGQLANARKYFEQAVQIYPEYASAWFKLGSILQKDHQNEAARKAYMQATTINPKFVPPYLFLAEMAVDSQNWTEVLQFTGRIFELDPLNKTNITGYIVDLDPVNYAEAYFYNAVANFKLNKIDEAEKSALLAEHIDLRTRFQEQLHLLLAEVFTRKDNYAAAVLELQTYLELAPQAKDADPVRERLAKLEKLSSAASAN